MSPPRQVPLPHVPSMSPLSPPPSPLAPRMPSLSPAPVRAPAPAAGQEAGEDDTFLQSVVVVHATIVEVDFASPWHKEKPDRSRGSGFIIADPRAPARGRLILTNAHVVDYSTEVFVQRYQSDDRVRARILRLVTDCDVAILVVEDDEFWDGEDGVRLPPLTFGVMPKIQDVVRVVGYPENGTEVCVTNGSVCRIQHQEYTHSEVELLSLETTAHIAHGNSGGPVLNKDGEVVGIAFQGTDRVGEFIPHCVFSRFLQVDENTKMGEIQSVAGLSFLWQKLENKTFRRSLGLDNMEGNNRSGIYVSSVDAFGAVAGVLQVGDVIVEMEGVSVGNVGTILLQGNRIGFMHLITSRAVGDIIHVGVVRDGVRLNVEWSLSSADVSYLVPKYDRLKNRGLPPDYVVIGGLVFCSFSKQLFHSLGGAHSHLYHLLEALDFGRKEQEDDEYVVLSRLLPNEAVNLGYSSAELESRRVCSLNGTKVRNLRHFADLYRESEGPYLRIDLTIPSFPSATTLVLDRELIAEEEANILEEYQVPKWCRLSSDAAEDESKASNSSASEDGEGMADNAGAERSSELGKGYESADDSSVTSPVVCSKCGCNPADAGSDFTGESAREYT